MEERAAGMLSNKESHDDDDDDDDDVKHAPNSNRLAGLSQLSQSRCRVSLLPIMADAVVGAGWGCLKRQKQ